MFHASIMFPEQPQNRTDDRRNLQKDVDGLVYLPEGWLRVSHTAHLWRLQAGVVQTPALP